jgi:predicted amidophosphoribosyltransferase
MTRLLQPFIEFIYPPSCYGCGCRMPSHADRLCATCRASLVPVAPADPLFCEALSRLTADGYFDGLVTCFRFEKEGMLQSLIHQLKYAGATSIGVLLGVEVGCQAAAMLPLGEIDGVIPVPLHAAKERERGYNQSAYIARGIAECTGIPVVSRMLVRRRHTLSQTALTIEDRERNMDGAFQPGPAAVRGAARRGAARRDAARRNAARRNAAGGSFLLVDDVMTTGATMRACASALRDAGARRLYAGTVALAV